MAKLPGAEDLGPAPSGRTGRAIATVDTTAIGRGIATLGQGMRALSAGVADLEKNRADVDDGQRFATHTDFLEFESAQKNALADRIMNAPPGAEGFLDQTRADYLDAAKKFLASVPEPLKPQYDGALFKLEDTIATAAKDFALREADRVAKVKIEDGENVLLDRLNEHPEAWKELDAEHDELLKNSGRAKIDQDIAAREWRKRRAEALWQVDSVKSGPEARGRLGVSGPAAPMPADVQGRASMARDHFVKLGYTPAQAAGIVGNLVQESGVRSDGPSGDNGTAHGMAQWRGERLTRLKRFAAANGRDWRDFTTQLNFIDMELKNHETGAYRALKSASTVEEATAAFIGYERPAGWSPGNPKGGHGWNNRLAAAQRTAGQEVDVSDVAPEYADIPYEDRVKLFDQSVAAEQKAITEAQAQATAQRTVVKESLSLGIETGTVVSEQEILSAPIDDGDKATLLKAFRSRNETDLQLQADLAALNSGSLALDPYSAKDKARADNLYLEIMKQVGPDNAVAVAGAVLDQTGIVPQPALNTMRRGLSGTDIGEFVTAAQTAQKVSALNPAALGRRDGGSEVQKIADDFGFMVNTLNLSPEEAARRLIDKNSPEKQFQRKALEPAAKEFLKSLQDEDLAVQFDDSLLGWSSNPDIGFSPGQEFGIRAEYLAIAEDQFYVVNGDADLARNRAIEEMKRLYGVTEFTGRKVVMKHPPERYWPAMEAQFQAGGPAKSYEGAAVGESAAFGESGRPLTYREQLESDVLATDANADLGTLQLVTTPQTDREVKSGAMPGYSVMWKDKDGVLQTLPGKLWKPDFTDALRIQAEERAATESEARAYRERTREKIGIREHNRALNPLALPMPEPGSYIPADRPANSSEPR